jgi:hypothetical protein
MDFSAILWALEYICRIKPCWGIDECSFTYGLEVCEIFSIVTCRSDFRRGCGLDIGFIGRFNTQLVITLNYNAVVTHAHRYCLCQHLQFHSMYNSGITIHFLHHDTFRPLILAIIRQYLYTHSQLSLLFPLHWPIFTTWGRSFCPLLCSFLVMDLNAVSDINLCPGVPKGMRFLQ